MNPDIREILRKAADLVFPEGEYVSPYPDKPTEAEKKQRPPRIDKRKNRGSRQLKNRRWIEIDLPDGGSMDIIDGVDFRTVYIHNSRYVKEKFAELLRKIGVISVNCDERGIPVPVYESQGKYDQSTDTWVTESVVAYDVKGAIDDMAELLRHPLVKNWTYPMSARPPVMAGKIGFPKRSPRTKEKLTEVIVRMEDGTLERKTIPLCTRGEEKNPENENLAIGQNVWFYPPDKGKTNRLKANIIGFAPSTGRYLIRLQTVGAELWVNLSEIKVIPWSVA